MKLKFFWIAVFLACASTALANSVAVNCGGGQTIQSALDNLYNTVSNHDHTVTVSGACHESVSIVNFERLTLQGTAGAMISPPNPDQPTIFILNSRMITVENLDVANITTGSGDDLNVNDVVYISNSTVDIQRCTLHDGLTGANITGVSQVNLRQSTIQDNLSHGVQIIDTSSMNVTGSGPTLIRNNFAGIFVRDRASVRIGCNVTLRENPFWALRVHTGSAMVNCPGDPVAGPFMDIVDNAVGMIGALGAHLRIQGSGVRVKDNSGVGLRLTQATANLTGVLFEGNGLFGAGELYNEGGIHVMLGSSLSATSTTVRGNHQVGIDVEQDSALEFFSGVVTGNEGEGVRVESLSTANLGVMDPSAPVNSIRGNHGNDLFCAPNSFASGDKAGIGKMFCPGFGQSPKQPKLPKPE